MNYASDTKTLPCGDVFGFWRIGLDVNGNSRHVVHFLSLLPAGSPLGYADALRAANRLGGRKYTARWFGGGVVFQAQECELVGIVSRCRELLSEGGAA